MSGRLRGHRVRVSERFFRFGRLVHHRGDVRRAGRAPGSGQTGAYPQQDNGGYLFSRQDTGDAITGADRPYAHRGDRGVLPGYRDRHCGVFLSTRGVV